MKIVASIVSHGHQSVIENTGLIGNLDCAEVHIRENIPTEKRSLRGNIKYHQNLSVKGFGENHNANFVASGASENDWFVVINPDISLGKSDVGKLIQAAERQNLDIAVPFLFNSVTQSFDDNVRRWPTLLNLISAFLGKGEGGRYSLEEVDTLTKFDWASGAFFAIRADTFRNLNGFDEGFFMYMEDVDLFRRASVLNARMNFFRDITVVHDAARDNRRIFSKNFFYHIKSIVRYFWKYR